MNAPVEHLRTKAQEALDRDPPPERTDLEDMLEILNNNTSIPIINTDEEGNIAYTSNIDSTIVNNSSKAHDFLERIRDENEPIIIDLGAGQKQYIYYGNSHRPQ